MHKRGARRPLYEGGHDRRLRAPSPCTRTGPDLHACVGEAPPSPPVAAGRARLGQALSGPQERRGSHLGTRRRDASRALKDYRLRGCDPMTQAAVGRRAVRAQRPVCSPAASCGPAAWKGSHRTGAPGVTLCGGHQGRACGSHLRSGLAPHSPALTSWTCLSHSQEQNGDKQQQPLLQAVVSRQ